MRLLLSICAASLISCAGPLYSQGPFGLGDIQQLKEECLKQGHKFEWHALSDAAMVVPWQIRWECLPKDW